MIRVSFTIKNPFAKDVCCDIMEYDTMLTQHKHFEAEHYYCNYNLFQFNLDTSWRGEDHAGPEIELNIIGCACRYKIYDTRHWDYTKGTWKQ